MLNITLEELLQRYEKGERDFRKISLIFDLYERDESGEAKVDEFSKSIRRPGIGERCLSGTNLSGVDFRGSDLSDPKDVFPRLDSLSRQFVEVGFERFLFQR